MTSCFQILHILTDFAVQTGHAVPRRLQIGINASVVVFQVGLYLAVIILRRECGAIHLFDRLCAI